MATEIKMPQLSDTMDSGKILEWKVSEGTAVSRGDILAEVETDKANLEIESFFNGTLLKIMTPAGSSANVGEIIAVLGEAGESVDITPAATASTTSGESTTAEPAVTAPEINVPSSPSPATGSGSKGLSVVQQSSSRIKASPLAKKVAEHHQVNLSGVQGTGPNGRIVRRDVEAALGTSPVCAVGNTAPQEAPPQLPPSTQPTAPSTQSSGGTVTPLSKMRETIARRMQESVTTAPHFYVTTTVDMGEATRLRLALKEREDFKGISMNHLVIKAVGYALKREPRVNAAMRDGQLFQPEGINIGIITAIEDGLLIPVLRNADSLPLKDLVFEARAAIERVRAGRPSASDLSGGTFSISNMGMFDVENFTAIINPGQGGILAVSAIKEQPIVKNGMIVPGSLMKATVSVDHRIIDGIMASSFLKHFKEALELPALLM
jgi:pyruvate dehydrogenase E2 component (dihydrolipoamide acetyltransferase)